MNFYKFFLTQLPFAIFLGIGLSSCLDRDFDEPPVKERTIPFNANSSIAYIKSLYQPGKFVDITEDISIIGIVIADDKSGNFYKTLVIQDSTAGIELKVNRTGLHANFPIGSKIGIKCKGLTVGDYAGLIQLGQGTYLDGNVLRLSGIEDVVTDQYLFQGPKNQILPVKVKTISGLTSIDLSTLVEFEQVEFERIFVGNTYADAVNQQSANNNIVDCSGQTIILRTSGFADFASFKIPALNGKIRGVLSKFNRDLQIYIRDTTDVRFIDVNCNQSGVDVPATITDIRSLFSGTNVTIKDNYVISGIVISDRHNGNINSRNIFLQDNTAGIAIRFLANHDFDLGDEVRVKLNGVELSEFSGLLQLNNINQASVIRISSNNSVSPKILTLASINTQFETLEGQLIKIPSAKLSKSGGGTYEGNLLINDGSGNMNLFTSSSASFSQSNFPIDSVSIVGIVSQFNSKQIIIRNLQDIQVISTGSGGNNFTSIRNVRNYFSGTKVNIDSIWVIKGLVSSDKNALNIVGQNLYIQDTSGAILVRFVSNHSYELGDEIEIQVKGVELSEFNGLLQLNSTPLANSKLVSKANMILPKILTIKEIVDQGEHLEGQLVTIKNVSISKQSGSNYSGTTILNDGTGSLDCFTRTQASFSNDIFPSSAQSLTGNVSQFNSRQIILRNLNDVKP